MKRDVWYKKQQAATVPAGYGRELYRGGGLPAKSKGLLECFGGLGKICGYQSQVSSLVGPLS